MSLGETRAAGALIAALREREPGIKILLTHSTATGHDAGTALLRDGTAYVQAGAGIVADSNPAAEYEETRDKARAVIRALELAQAGL